MTDVDMTGEARANRTFRSIFGDEEKRHDEVLYLELEQRDSNTSIASDSGIALALNDDDDEIMWNDEPLLGDDASLQNINTDIPVLQFAQRKSMEEWADEDDEEENWKEALQDRVNQLELAFQHNDDSAAAQSRRQLKQQQVQLLSVHDTNQCTDFTQSLPVPSARFAASGDSNRFRQFNRHKMQRTSSSHACITGDNTVTFNRQDRLWNFQRKVAGETSATMLNQNRRMRLTSIDLVGRNSQTVGHHRKRSGSLGGSVNRTESPRHLMLRENSFDNSRSTFGRSCSSSNLGGTNAVPPEVATCSSRAAVFNLSDTEAIRRFVLEDAKTMSMERLVSDAQRLHFLEGLYQNRQGLCPMPSVTTSTAPSLASSSSAMSTS